MLLLADIIFVTLVCVCIAGFLVFSYALLVAQGIHGLSEKTPICPTHCDTVYS